MVLAYRKAILNAFKEVSDALAGYDRTRQQRTQEALLVRALEESTRLSRLRYTGGLDSYLQVLDAQFPVGGLDPLGILQGEVPVQHGGHLGQPRAVDKLRQQLTRSREGKACFANAASTLSCG